MVTELAEQVSDTQKLVESFFAKEVSDVCRLPNWVNYLRIIADAPDDVVKTRLGETGRKLKKFAMRTNLNHPDIEVFVNGLPKCAIDMFKFSSEVLGQEDNKLQEEVYETWSDAKAVIKGIQQPRARLLVADYERVSQRSVKKHPKNIGLKSLFAAETTGENAFFGRPLNFHRFARGSNVGHQEMANLDAKRAKFRSINMNDLAESFNKRIQSLQSSMADYFGFYRIRPDEASVTLARLHGFKWSETGTVIIPSKFFGDFRFWTEKVHPTTSIDAKVEAVKKTLILNTKFAPIGNSSTNFGYQARMYPLPQFIQPTGSAKSVIDKVERFSALGNNPFFDYLWVLVPSVNINHPMIRHDKDVEKWVLVDESNTTTTFDNQNDAVLFLDSKLVEKKLVYPIIIGERDGKCYFLSMWS